MCTALVSSVYIMEFWEGLKGILIVQKMMERVIMNDQVKRLEKAVYLLRSELKICSKYGAQKIPAENWGII